MEQLWARRKVGYMLDQIRANGEKKELVDEVVALAKKYGITTPYTSWLIVPDAAVPVVNANPLLRPMPGRPGGVPGPRVPVALEPGKPEEAAKPVVQFLKEAEGKDKQSATTGSGGSGTSGLGGARGDIAERELAKDDRKTPDGKANQEAFEKKKAYDTAGKALRGRDRDAVQTGKLGVDLSVQMQNLRNQTKLDMTALKNVQGRNLLEIGGVWIDEGFKEGVKLVVVKAQGDAYFRILDRHADMKDVYRLGNHLVWITPSGAALVIDANDGKDKLSDEEIDKLFVAVKK